jgi:hypothetical protein
VPAAEHDQVQLNASPLMPPRLLHYGVETQQVWALSVDGETRNRRGVAWEDVAAAVTEREDTDEPR